MTTITEHKLLIHDLVDTNSSTFSDARMVRGMNKAQNKVANVIMQNDYLCQYDDENYTDYNFGYLNLVISQNNYNIKEDENFAGLLFVVKVFVKDAGGNWAELKKEATSFDSTSGQPTKYRFTKNDLILSPTPSASVTNGLLIYFAREPKTITVSDTTRQIGMPRTFDHLIDLYTAYDYARAKRMDNRNDLLSEILQEEQRLGLFVASKNKQVVNRMTPSNESNR